MSLLKKDLLKDKGVRLFIVLAGFFVTNALTAEFLGVKIFALEPTLGWEPFNWNLFGHGGSLSFTAGVLLWPIVFVMTDIINEYFGFRGVRMLSWMTAGLITYSFFMVYMAIGLEPADWWVTSVQAKGVADYQSAYEVVFGQGLWIIVASLVAFLIGQFVDVFIFQRIKKLTGERSLWLRATGSTLFSQLIDSFVVLYIAFVLGPQNWPISLMLAVGTVNYIYKVIAAIVLTPLLYVVHWIIDAYLGKEKAEEMKTLAANRS